MYFEIGLSATIDRSLRKPCICFTNRRAFSHLPAVEIIKGQFPANLKISRVGTVEWSIFNLMSNIFDSRGSGETIYNYHGKNAERWYGTGDEYVRNYLLPRHEQFIRCMLHMADCDDPMFAYVWVENLLDQLNRR